MRNRSVLALSSVIALAFAGLVATPAHAAALTAATEAELVAAINTANGNGEADVITLTGTGFALTADLPPITGTLSIVGPGSGVFTLQGGTGDPVVDNFYNAFVSTGSASNTAFSLSGITIERAGNNQPIAGFPPVNPRYAVETVEVDLTMSDVVIREALWGGVRVTDPLASVVSSDISLTDVVVDGSVNSFFDVDDVQYGRGLTAELRNDSSLTVVDSEFVDNIDRGIDVETHDTSSLTIRNSEASGNDGDGVNVELEGDSTALIEDVIADNNTFDGIDLDAEGNSSATIRDSSVEDNGDNGFESDNEDSSIVRYENLLATDNDGHGFDVEADDDSTSTLINPVASDNGETGLLLEPDTAASTITVTGGRAEGNGQYGMHMDVDQGTITSDGFVASGNDQGGVYIDGFNGQATLLNATVSDNNLLLAGSGGGGIDVDARLVSGGPLIVLIESTTISGNRAENGGGIGGTVRGGSTLRVINSTISNNRAEVVGSGLVIEGDLDSGVLLAHSTFTLNETIMADSGAVNFDSIRAAIAHTIIADNFGVALTAEIAESNADLTIDHSLVRSGDFGAIAALTAGTGNIVGQSAGLGPLADNGGPTFTHLPNPGSPVIGAGNAAIVGAPATDQRGDDRIVGVIEIGSVEVQAPELAATGANNWISTLAAGIALLLVLGGSVLLVARQRTSVTAAR